MEERSSRACVLLFYFSMSSRKQPQDFVFPLLRSPLPTHTSLPQSHRHSHTIEPHWRFWVGIIAVSRPNFFPVRSTPAQRLAQPQDLVFPLIRLPVATSFSPPQSHRHRQTTAPRSRSSVGSTAISLPNLCPVKSFAFRKKISPFTKR